jgi:hypothetical protein
MPYIEIPNKKKVQKKFDYRVDKNMQNPLPADFIAEQRRRSLKYTKK